MTDIKKRTWRLYPLLAPQLEALGIAHCSRNEQPKTPRRYERICPIVYIHSNKRTPTFALTYITIIYNEG